MKHLETFRQVVADPYAYARGLKEETGQKIVGYVCSYTPEEIILAAGGHPMRLLGTSNAIHLADSHLQTYCCALARGVLEEGLSGRASFLDGVVFPHTCDAVQRLSDIWRINIPFGFHLDAVLPVKLDTPSARAYMADTLDRFRGDLGQALGREVTDEALRKALRTMNVIREAIRDLYELRRRSPCVLAGRDLYTVVRASMIMERENLAFLLSESVTELKAAAAGAGGEVPTKRVLLAGGLCNIPDVYSLVEDAGGTVVWDDFCTGSRYFATISDADAGPPMTAIANRFLERVVCPAKHGGLERRADHILLLARDKEASGVVFVLPKFCDPHAFDYPHIKQRLDEAGIPNLLIEIDDPLPALGQLKTRFDAFMEML